jgi:hypothetical protein
MLLHMHHTDSRGRSSDDAADRRRQAGAVRNTWNSKRKSGSVARLVNRRGQPVQYVAVTQRDGREQHILAKRDCGKVRADRTRRGGWLGAR